MSLIIKNKKLRELYENQICYSDNLRSEIKIKQNLISKLIVKHKIKLKLIKKSKNNYSKIIENFQLDFIKDLELLNK